MQLTIGDDMVETLSFPAGKGEDTLLLALVVVFAEMDQAGCGSNGAKR